MSNLTNEIEKIVEGVSEEEVVLEDEQVVEDELVEEQSVSEEESEDVAEAKKEALLDAGIAVSESPSDMGATLIKHMGA